jgi:glycosyltransferase involved in cell wall biosynthesis
VFDERAPPTPSPLGRPLLVFVGNFAYEPNLDAARFLCAEILPRVRAAVPDVRLALVGTSPPPELEQLAQDGEIVVTGRVYAVEPYLDQADVVVAPLRVGGGPKLKMLEALVRGTPVVATSVAVQGLGPEVGRVVRVVDDAARFAAAVTELLRRPEERLTLSLAARTFAERLPRWDDSADALFACYQELQDRSPRGARI